MANGPDWSINPFGNSASDGVTYVMGGVSAGVLITSAHWENLESIVNQERNRRGQGGISIVTAPGETIDGVDLNGLATGLNTLDPTSGVVDPYHSSGPTYVPNIPSVSVGQLITAAQINEVMNELATAGASCFCNCNYCACNCNYCTCNCNYACTCNCNYSDERLKNNIKFIETQNGLKVYSYNYVWDKDTRHVGVMAQEILTTKYMDAIKKDMHGYFMVDYSKLPLNLKGL